MTTLQSLRVLIVDDEELARLRLHTLLADCVAPPAQVLADVGSAAAALQWLSQHRCDLVLLDIHLPGLDGLQLAERLRSLPAPPAVVFVTAHAHHALAAFDVQALDYLTKPVRRARLQEALQRVAHWIARTPAPVSMPAPVSTQMAAPMPVSTPTASTPAAAPDAPVPQPVWAATEPMAWASAAPAASVRGSRSDSATPVISVHERGEWLRVPVHEVLYLKAELKYVTLRTAARTHLVESSLAELEERFGRHPRHPFVRVHRNALVAVAAVRAFERRSAEAPPTACSPDDDERHDDRSDERAEERAEERGWAVHIGATDEWLAVSRRQLSAVRQALADFDRSA